ncbi:hypothetical protein D3C86_2184450 [compost metagenome]
MQVFGNQIGAEGNEKADQDLRAWVFAELAGNGVLYPHDKPRHAEADKNAADRDPKKCAQRIG